MLDASVVVQTDISSFYEHVSHHRIENLVGDLFSEASTVATQIDRFLSRFASGRSFGLPVGGQCSRINLAKDTITACQVSLLAELTAYHSGTVRGAGAAVGGHPAFEGKPIIISDSDAGFGEFQKFHVRLLTGFAERLAEIEQADLAESDVAKASGDVGAMISSDPILQRTSIAVILEPRLAGGTNASLSLPALVIKSLYPSIREGDREALQILFQSLYRLRDFDEFMIQFEAIWSEPMREESWLDLLGLSYEVAVISRHPLADELRASIDALGANGIQLVADEVARRHAIQSRLTPMARKHIVYLPSINAATRRIMA